MTYGHWAIHNDTLILRYERLQERAKGDTAYNPVKYTMYDGKVFTVTNASILVETKKYLIRGSLLLFIKSSNHNSESSTWGDFDFTFKCNTNSG